MPRVAPTEQHMLHALAQTGLESDLQHHYPEGPGEDSVMDRYLRFADGVRQHLVANGGITAPASTLDIRRGLAPLPVGPGAKWFGIGGAPDYRRPDRAPVPEKVYLGQQFNTAATLGHVLDVESHQAAREKAGAPPVMVGGWVENPGEHVLDHSVVVGDEGHAQALTEDADQRAYFDAETMESKDREGNVLL